MASSKVVKVDDVHGPPQNAAFMGFERSRTNQSLSTDFLAFGTDSSYLPTTSRIDDGSGLYDEETTEEAHDKVFPLPENWPKIPQIFRRRSCELTMATSPCVNKAVSHLELLQNVIEDWSKEKVYEIQSRQASARASAKDVRFEGKGLRSASTRASSASALSVTGQGLTAPQKVEIVEPAMPYLGAEDAVDEVMTLLARLENDRQETENALEREKDRVIRLSNKIDHHRQRRMKELPEVVQREHEESIVDLNEMQWHVAYSSRNESRIKERVEIAEVLNNRLKEDIDFVKKHIPLVEEKLELELEAMSKIRNAQNETNQELDNTRNRQEKTEAKSGEAYQKAEKERGHIKKELDTVREALASINEDLSESKMTYNAYIHQINDITQQLKDNEQELKVLEVKVENAKVAEEMQAAKVAEINTKIVDAEFENARLDSENTQLQAQLNTKKRQYSNTINELEQIMRARDSKLRQVELKNKEVEMEVQDFEDKKKECKRQKDMDEKNVKRIYKEMQKIQMQLSVTIDEFNRVAAINSTIRDQLISEQEKTHKMEESLKMTADSLKRQVKDEVHTKSVMTARISSDKQEIQKSRGDIRQKKNKAAKVADEVVTAVNTVREKVEKLRSAKENKNRKKSNLSAQREETVKQMEESERKFDERKNQLEPHHKHLSDDLLNVSRRMDHIEWKSEMMNNKMGDMDKSQGMIDRLLVNTKIALETIGGQLVELDLQIQAAQKIEDDLKMQLNARIRDSQQGHRKLMDERKIKLRELEEQKVSSMKMNKELASMYRTLQNNQMVVKDKYINNFGDRVKMENSIKDVRELQALQLRMQGAMTEYYKLRGLYNTSELSRMEDMSIKNSEKVSELQGNMDTALKNITEFLQTQMTGEAIKKTAWDNLQKNEQRRAAREMRREARAMKLKSTSTVTVAS
ncbi:CC178-like protein [Mya arenaria]|uniref:CC178-like protein n=1 Tax=Mya arenaria TaxID=6604 RepID=A0ABY7FYX4_MYAAR|nr:CC178-like protein [Mya arenaria]